MPFHIVYLQNLTVNHAEICTASTKKMWLYFEQIKFKGVIADISALFSGTVTYGIFFVLYKIKPLFLASCLNTVKGAKNVYSRFLMLAPAQSLIPVRFKFKKNLQIVALS